MPCTLQLTASLGLVERDAGRAWTEISAARNVTFTEQRQGHAPVTLLIAPLFVSEQLSDHCRSWGSDRDGVLLQFNGLDKEKFGWQGRGSTGNILVWKGNGVSANCVAVSCRDTDGLAFICTLGVVGRWLSQPVPGV